MKREEKYKPCEAVSRSSLDGGYLLDKSIRPKFAPSEVRGERSERGVRRRSVTLKGEGRSEDRGEEVDGLSGEMGRIE